MTGHMMGAAGAFEAFATVMTVAEQCVPGTINYREFDPEADVWVVPETTPDARALRAVEQHRARRPQRRRSSSSAGTAADVASVSRRRRGLAVYGGGSLAGKLSSDASLDPRAVRRRRTRSVAGCSAAGRSWSSTTRPGPTVSVRLARRPRVVPRGRARWTRPSPVLRRCALRRPPDGGRRRIDPRPRRLASARATPLPSLQSRRSSGRRHPPQEGVTVPSTDLARRAVDHRPRRGHADRQRLRDLLAEPARRRDRHAPDPVVRRVRASRSRSRPRCSTSTRRSVMDAQDGPPHEPVHPPRDGRGQGGGRRASGIDFAAMTEDAARPRRASSSTPAAAGSRRSSTAPTSTTPRARASCPPFAVPALSGSMAAACCRWSTGSPAR